MLLFALYVLSVSGVTLACYPGALFPQASAPTSTSADYEWGCGNDCDEKDEYDSSNPYLPEKPTYKPPEPYQPPAHQPDPYTEPLPLPKNPYLEAAPVHLPYTTYRNQVCNGKQIGSSQGESIGSAVIKCVQLGCEAANAVPRGDGKYDCTFLQGVEGRSVSPGAYCVSGRQIPHLNHIRQEFKSRRSQVQQQAAVLSSGNNAIASSLEGFEDILSPNSISTSSKPTPSNNYEDEDIGLPIELRKLVISSSNTYVPPYIPKPTPNVDNFLPSYIPPLPSSHSPPPTYPPTASHFASRIDPSTVQYKPFPDYIPPPRETNFPTVPSPFARK